ncbi:hypothetical protein MO408_27230 (plasmid) [Klebsiella pneumoniae]|nr:hypothetical protein MO408_27230 [Klebsiella pneumoniae]
MAVVLTGMLYGLEKVDSDAVERISNTPRVALIPAAGHHGLSGLSLPDGEPGTGFSQQWVLSKLEALTQFETIVTAEESAMSF